MKWKLEKVFWMLYGAIISKDAKKYKMFPDQG